MKTMQNEDKIIKNNMENEGLGSFERLRIQTSKLPSHHAELNKKKIISIRWMSVETG